MSGGMSALTVYKLGGPALEDADLLPALAGELRRARSRVLVVHGGGRHVERTLKALGIESRFIGGRRETSPEAMEVVEMVLSGVVNKALAAGLTAAGLPAVGLSGRDAGLLRARVQPGLGHVGTPEAVDLALAVALRASALVYLSDVDGVRLDGEAAEWLDAETARREMTRGAIAGGMAMKVETALQAVAAGVPEVIVAGKARLLGGFGGTHVRTDAAAGARA